MNFEAAPLRSFTVVYSFCIWMDLSTHLWYITCIGHYLPVFQNLRIEMYCTPAAALLLLLLCTLLRRGVQKLIAQLTINSCWGITICSNGDRWPSLNSILWYLFIPDVSLFTWLCPSSAIIILTKYSTWSSFIFLSVFN